VRISPKPHEETAARTRRSYQASQSASWPPSEWPIATSRVKIASRKVDSAIVASYSEERISWATKITADAETGIPSL
jgi:hypothetical protein